MLVVTAITYFVASSVAASVAMDRDDEDLGGVMAAFFIYGPAIAVLAAGITVVLLSVFASRPQPSPTPLPTATIHASRPRSTGSGADRGPLQR